MSDETGRAVGRRAFLCATGVAMAGAALAGAPLPGEAVDTEEVHRYFDRLGSEIKELRIYENEYHGISRFTDEVASMSADFLRDRLNGVPPREKRRIVYVDWNRMEHPVNEDRIRRGFSDLVAETS